MHTLYIAETCSWVVNWWSCIWAVWFCAPFPYISINFDLYLRVLLKWRCSCSWNTQNDGHRPDREPASFRVTEPSPFWTDSVRFATVPLKNCPWCHPVWFTNNQFSALAQATGCDPLPQTSEFLPMPVKCNLWWITWKWYLFILVFRFRPVIIIH